MLYHPYIVLRIAEAHIEDLRREAARERRAVDRFDELPTVLKDEPARRPGLPIGRAA